MIPALVKWYLTITMRAIPCQKCAVGGGGSWAFLGGTYHHNSILLTPPYMHILNSILHLEPPCATPSSHILNYLIPPTPALQIIFRSPHPRVTFENGIALMRNNSKMNLPFINVPSNKYYIFTSVHNIHFFRPPPFSKKYTHQHFIKAKNGHESYKNLTKILKVYNGNQHFWYRPLPPLLKVYGLDTHVNVDIFGWPLFG